MNEKHVTSGYDSLDILATFRVSSDVVVLERLKTVEALDGWLGLQGFLVQEGATISDLAEAKVLRKAIYHLVMACMRKSSFDAEDLDIVHTWASRFRVLYRLTAPGNGISEPATVSDCLAAMAFEAVQLLGGDNALKIGKCSREFCDRFFVDSSRSQLRRWCDMGVCGNRAKVNACLKRKKSKNDL